MAVSFISIGAHQSGSTSVTPVIPTHASGDLLVITVATGHSTGSTEPACSGWTKQSTVVGGGGTFGEDTGPRRHTFFTLVASSGSTTNPTVTLSTGSVMTAAVMVLRAPSGAYSTAFATGEDTSVGTSYSVTAGSNPGLILSDLIVVGTAINEFDSVADVHTITASGATVGTVTERLDIGTTTGGNITHLVATAQITNGTASSPPVYTATLQVAGSGASGFMRVRESGDTPPPASEGNLPEVFIDVALNQGWNTASYTWTDITAYVENPEGIKIERGRKDERSTADPARLTLTLNNKDGRFTPGLTSGAYYPNIRKGLPIRVRGRWPVGGTMYARFMGYIDDWPVVWPNGSTILSTVSITASGTLARLANNAQFKSVVEEEILYDGPTALYPLSEESGSTQVGDISGNQFPSMQVWQDTEGTGGTVEFAAVDGPKTDNVGAPFFDPVSETDGKMLRVSDDIEQEFVPNLGRSVAIECFFQTKLDQTDAVMLHLGVRGTSERLSLGLTMVSGDCVIRAVGVLDNGTGTLQTSTLNGNVNLADNKVHHAVLYLVRDTSTTMKLNVKVDGGTAQTSAAITMPSNGTDPLLPKFDRLIVGNREVTSGPGTAAYEGMVSHATVFMQESATSFTVTRFEEHAEAGLTGFSGETVSDRLARYAKWTGLPTARMSVTGSDVIGHIDTAGKSPLEAMREIERTEGGVLFDGGDGSVVYQARANRYTATSSFILNAAEGHFEDDIEFRLDDQFLTNEVVASRDEGANVRVFDQTSIDLYGPYIQDLDLAGTTDEHVLAAAQWIVARYAEPTIRVPQISVNLYAQSSSMVTSLLQADIGTMLTLSGLPNQAPASSIELFIEGISESINHEEWTITFDLSPASLADAWLLGDANFGQLGVSTHLAF